MRPNRLTRLDPGDIDLAAKRLWRRARPDATLRWLLEGVLDGRQPPLGRSLLLAESEICGELPLRLSARLTLPVRVAGYPYLSGPLRRFAPTVGRILRRREEVRTQAKQVRHALEHWQERHTERIAQTMLAFGVELVRSNPALQTLANGATPVTWQVVARAVRGTGTLDFDGALKTAMASEPLFVGKQSKALLRGFTLNMDGLAEQMRPERAQELAVLGSAEYVLKLLANRAVSEAGWRDVVIELARRDMLAPASPLFSWCRRCWADTGFVISMGLAQGRLPPLCPSCGKPAYAMAVFQPSGNWAAASGLKDGLLGAAVGWYLTKRAIPFSHGQTVGGEETDFIVETRQGPVLIECKMLYTQGNPKQRLRNVRDAVEQTQRHANLLAAEGHAVHQAVCVLNLTGNELADLGYGTEATISFEDFTAWASRLRA